MVDEKLEEVESEAEVVMELKPFNPDEAKRDLKKFEAFKLELTELAKQFSEYSILGVKDKVNYELVHKGQMKLGSKRREIEKFGLRIRQGARAFAKEVLTKEKELTSIISPVEKYLKEQKEFINDLKLKEKRMELIPERREKMDKIGMEMTDEELCALDSVQFTEIYSVNMEEFISKQAEIKAKQEEEAREKKTKEEEKVRKLEAEKKAEVEKEKELDRVRKESEKKAKEDAEMEAKKKDEAREKKAKEEKEAQEKMEKEREDKAKKEKEAQDEVHRLEVEELKREKRESEEKADRKLEKARLEAEEEQRILEEEEAEREEKEKTRIAKEKKEDKQEKYINWLKEKGCNRKTKSDYNITRDGDTRILWKKIGEYK